MKKTKKRNAFSGIIELISCSPHGEPEGVVLDDGSFVKVPPHSLKAKDLFKIGAAVKGSGELLTEVPNKVFHHVKLLQGQKVLADDSMKKQARETLKDLHKKEMENIKEAPSKKMKLSGVIAAVGTKPKGEVDRLIFIDGTSVHLKKDIDLSIKDVQIGDIFEVRGKSRRYNESLFFKAESVRHL